ncbi:MAG: type II toxin-antitoxin system VapC family toxin [Deltaproteobacteria bacterium]|nr:type II toxin-antitoxin system VapC family toxin [Deltaproteobacteria bacterium]
MKARVVDTSVLAALVFGEPRASEARDLLLKARLLAPRLLGYELAHVAVKKIAMRPESAELVLQSFSLAMRLEIQWVDVDLTEVVKLARREKLSAYDASYLYASRTLGVELVTFDEELQRRARAPGT